MTTELLERFRAKAELVSAKVVPVSSLKEAMAYAVELCDKKEACQLLVSGCDLPVSGKAEDLCGDKVSGKNIAAPALSAAQLKDLRKLAGDKGISVVDSGMRKHVAGIDIGFTIMDAGIAETGTLVLDSSREDVRLATMLCEFHVAVLRTSTLKATANDVAQWMETRMHDAPNFTAFITGPSRTADIERVLALGVHGPLELHILVWEDK